MRACLSHHTPQIYLQPVLVQDNGLSQFFFNIMKHYRFGIQQMSYTAPFFSYKYNLLPVFADFKLAVRIP